MIGAACGISGSKLQARLISANLLRIAWRSGSRPG
jgi:hypothetical protein